MKKQVKGVDPVSLDHGAVTSNIIDMRPITLGIMKVLLDNQMPAVSPSSSNMV